MPESFDRPIDKRSYRAAKEQLIRRITETYTPPFAMTGQRLQAYRMLSRQSVTLILDAGLLYDDDPHPVCMEVDGNVELPDCLETIHVSGDIPPAVVMSRLLQIELMDRKPIADKLVVREHCEIRAVLRADDYMAEQSGIYEELEKLQALYDKILAGKAS